MIQHHEPVGEAHHGMHCMLDDADRHALLAQPGQHTQHVIAFLPAQAGQGLVEEQQAGVARQGAGQLHQAKLLVGELAGGHARPVLQSHLMERPHGRGDGVAVRQAGAVGSDDHVVEHGEAGEAAHHLERAANTHAADLEGLAAQHLLAVELGRAFVGREHAVQHVEQGRLARAIRTDDAEDFTLGDGEADFADRLQAAEGARQILDLQQRRARVSGRAAGRRRQGRQIGNRIGSLLGETSGRGRSRTARQATAA